MGKRSGFATRFQAALRGTLAGGVAALALAFGTARAAGQTEPAGAGIRVHGCDIHDITDADSGAATIHVLGARNGSYSGKVVVRSEQPIQGLQAKVTDLKQGSDAIPASTIQVRYGTTWDATRTSPPAGCDVLLEASAAGFPAGRVTIWVTTRIPQTAKPGTYRGQLTLEAKGLSPVQVPVQLDVREFALPDPQNYRTWIETVKSPDTLAIEYNLPLWSDAHWAMVAKTMRLVADSGDRTAYVPLIARTNYGNAESMVRWIKKGENRYDYDFTILDKYLDTVEKSLGTPKLIMVHAWEQYLNKPKDTTAKPKEIDPKWTVGSYNWREAMSYNARLLGKGPVVTVLDAATQKTSELELPRYEDPQAKELWKPVWDGVRQRLAQRGWDKAMMVGNMVDLWPTKEEATVLQELTGGAPWTCCAHHLQIRVANQTLGKLHKAFDVGYAAIALEEVYNRDPAKAQRPYGWEPSPLLAHYFRFYALNNATYPEFHNLAERVISGNKRGVGHIGADFWPCLKNKAGQRRGTVTDAYPESYWHSLNVGSYLLAPGPDGPVGTARLEIFREGIQECEARIAIEKALGDPALKGKLGAELAQRAQAYLDQRQIGIWQTVGVSDAERLKQVSDINEIRHWFGDAAKRAAGVKWYLGSGWQERNAQLYDLAAEVTRKVGP